MIVPDFKISLRGRDVTPKFANYVSSIAVVDEEGIKSDVARISLVDEGSLEIPKRGFEISISLGHKGDLIEIGSYSIGKHQLKKGIMNVDASACNYAEKFSEPKSRAWKNINVLGVVAQIASENELKPAIPDNPFNAYLIKFEEQRESDMSFLNKLAKRFGSIFKVQDNYLVFAKKGTEESVTGKIIPSHLITECVDYDYKEADTDSYTGVKTFYWDQDQKKDVPIVVGSIKKVYVTPTRHKTKEEAEQKAKEKLMSFDHGALLSLSMDSSEKINIARIASGHTLRVKGIHRGIDGLYRVKKASLNLNKGFYGTFECIRKKS